MAGHNIRDPEVPKEYEGAVDSAGREVSIVRRDARTRNKRHKDRPKAQHKRAGHDKLHAEKQDDQVAVRTDCELIVGYLRLNVQA